MIVVIIAWAVCTPLRRPDAREEQVNAPSERTLVCNGHGQHVFLTEKGGLGWPSREDVTVGSHLFSREKERRRGKCEKALETIASHGMDDFLDSYRLPPLEE